MGSDFEPWNEAAQYALPRNLVHNSYEAGAPSSFSDPFFDQGLEVFPASYSQVTCEQATAQIASDALSGLERGPTVQLKGGNRIPPRAEKKIASNGKIIYLTKGGIWRDAFGRQYDEAGIMMPRSPQRIPNGAETKLAKDGTIIYKTKTGKWYNNGHQRQYDETGNRMLSSKREIPKGAETEFADDGTMIFQIKAGKWYDEAGNEIRKPTKPKTKQDQKIRKRKDILSDIGKLENPSSTNTTTFETQRSQFEQYLHTYYAVQANVSALVLPLIQTITDRTNNTLIHDVAMSAYVEIVGYPISISSPFVAGMNCIDWLEKQFFNGTNNSVAAITAKPKSNYTSDDISALQYFASYKTLLNVYNHAYYSGSKAANSTGLLDTLYTLKRYLTSNNTSIMPKDFTDVNTDYIKQFFPHQSNDTLLI